MDRSFAIYTGMHWAAVFVYILATIANVYGIIFRRERVETISCRLAVAGLLVHSAAIAYWWNIAGHGPYMTRNEVLSSDSWIMLTMFLLFRRYFPKIRPASIIVFPGAFLLIAMGLFFSPEIHTLTPIFTSIWLIFHIGFYKIAVGTIIIAFAFSLFYLLKKRTGFAWLERLPDLAGIDLYAYRFAGFGFVFWAIGMLAGSIWAYQSWGRFWGWDAVETWSLITWGMLGLHLHLRRFFNWRGEKAAYLYIVCFLLSITAVFFLSHLTTSIHSEYFK